MKATKKILIIGGNGYIGGNLRRLLIEQGHDVYYTTTSKHSYGNKILFLDILKPGNGLENLKSFINLVADGIDAVYVMAWPFLDKYCDSRHLELVLPSMKQLHDTLKNECRVKSIVYAGTCYEYGLMSGPLAETLKCSPVSEYARAKLELCQYVLPVIADESEPSVKWLRIFYPFGLNQRGSSLLPSLKRALEHRQPVFKMSKGDQVRDFIRIERLLELFIELGLGDGIASGIYNCGSGIPVRLISFVKSFIKRFQQGHGYGIELDNNAYPYRSDEPFSFWANMNKTNKAIRNARL